MHIALIGPGAIGSTLAFHLSRAGHQVTVVARGARLATLRRDGAVVRSDGARAAVEVSDQLEPAVPYDLLLVTVLASQVEPLLPVLQESAARRVMFLFNTFEPLDRLRATVGAARFHFGFPGGVFCLLIDGRIHPQIRAGTTVSDAALARCLSDAGIPTTVEPDMHSWLRTHAAMVAPLMSLGVRALNEGRGAAWATAGAHARALRAGFDLVRALGHPWLPRGLGALSRLPLAVLTALLWAFSRTRVLRDLGALGPDEARALIDAMTAAGPAFAAPLRSIRP
jgi:2-dehydropantoate 2-reductase